MKRVLLSVLFIIVAIVDVGAQGHYENEYIRFDYSSEYKKSGITSAQHMLLKIEDDDSFFSISEWKYGIDSDVDAWNDEIYEQYKSLPIKDGKLVSIEKKLIDTKDGKEKGLFILSNITANGINLKSASCLFVHRGNLYVLSHMSQGKYLPFSPCKDFLDMLKGLTLKDDRRNGTSNQQFRDKANNESGYWDEKSCTYANYFYGFSWNLERDLGWQQEIGTELHTVFKARAKELPIMVYVHANEYNDKLLNIDIWDKYEEIKSLQQTEMKRIGEKIGWQYEMISFEKAKLWNKHAIRYVYVTHKHTNSTNTDIKTYSVTYKTIHKGRIFSANIEMPFEVYSLAKEKEVDVENVVLDGFKFTVDQP